MRLPVDFQARQTAEEKPYLRAHALCLYFLFYSQNVSPKLLYIRLQVDFQARQTADDEKPSMLTHTLWLFVLFTEREPQATLHEASR